MIQKQGFHLRLPGTQGIDYLVAPQMAHNGPSFWTSLNKANFVLKTMNFKNKSYCDTVWNTVSVCTLCTCMRENWMI